MTRVMISCGEASGDLFAGALVREIRRQRPGTEVAGFGGEQLAAAGAELVGDYRGLTVTGLVEAIRVLPRALRMQRALVERARRERPDALVVIDFPDFNFRLASAFRALSIPVVYYVCPQLWAWRPGRIEVLRRIATKALVVFPFEPDFYRQRGLDVEFVGHPLLDLARATVDRTALCAQVGLDPSRPIVALLPGSRPNELRAMLPTLAAAIPQIRRRLAEVQLVAARAPHLADALFAPLQAARTRVAVVEGRTDDVLASADVVVTASGTATVQTAIHEKPMVIVYRLSPISYRLGKPLVRVTTYGMVNLVAGERIVPELIQARFTPEAVADETLRYFTDAAYAERTRARVRDVHRRLGTPGASSRAAARVLEVCDASSHTN
ncbi:MAG: lipid-A-disaccharide synthase [Acidobacteriota bacterium]